MTDHGSIVTGLAAGVGGAILALLGVDAQTLTAALLGCVFGASAAKPTSRVHGVCLFAAAVCASAEAAAVLGPMCALMAPAGWGASVDVSMWRRLVALAVGVLLHPLTAAATDATPGLVRWLTTRGKA